MSRKTPSTDEAGRARGSTRAAVTKSGGSIDTSPSLSASGNMPSLLSQSSVADVGAQLNVSDWLHHMFGTPHAAKFLEFVTAKHSPEPFLCWTALETLIGEVREDTLESPESRSQKVMEIIDEFVRDSGKNQMGLPMAVKEKLDELYKKIHVNREFWDGRPLLMLQREAELMLLPDVREFSEATNLEEVTASGALTGVLEVDVVPAKQVEARRNEILRKHRSFLERVRTKTRVATQKAFTIRRDSASSDLKKGSEAFGERSPGSGSLDKSSKGIRSEGRFCKLTTDSVTILPTSEENGSTPSFELKLSSVVVRLHPEHCVLELQRLDGNDVFFLRCEDVEQFGLWSEGIRHIQARLDKLLSQLREKRQKILSSSYATLEARIAQSGPVPADTLHTATNIVFPGDKVRVPHVPAALPEARKTSQPNPTSPTAERTDNLPSDLVPSDGSATSSNPNSNNSSINNLLSVPGAADAIARSMIRSSPRSPDAPPNVATVAPVPVTSAPAVGSGLDISRLNKKLRKPKTPYASDSSVPTLNLGEYKGVHSLSGMDLTRKNAYFGVGNSGFGSVGFGYGPTSPHQVSPTSNYNTGYATGYRSAMQSSAAEESDAREDDRDRDRLGLSSDDDMDDSSGSDLVANGDLDSESNNRRGDFNEVFQTCVTRLRNCSGYDEDSERVRLETYVELIGLAEDFVSSAVRYGQIIISEVYLPNRRKTIKPNESVGGVIGGEKYIVHNILFKFALDSHGVFGGNDESAAKVAGLELKGLQAYLSSQTPDLCYPLMALIDYKGFRLVASSLLPLTPSSLVYGSQDAGVTVLRSNDRLAARIEEASAKLNLKLHEAGKDRVMMATAVDIEGHVGRDNRFYLLDFSRVFPPVTPNRTIEGSHLFQMFRPEFVKSFTLFPLCSDAYSRFTVGLPDAKEHTEEVDLATMELLNVTISNFVAELIAKMTEEARIAGTLENFNLVQLMHSHGINVRYLGEVARKMGRHPFAMVVLSEMVARIVKIGFRQCLRAEMKRLKVSIDEPYRIAAKDFLNKVFSATPASETYWNEDVTHLLNTRFQLRRGNWNAFPKFLKRTLFELDRIGAATFNAKAFIFSQVQKSLGLKVAPSVVNLLRTQPKIYLQTAVFDDVDIEDVGLRVKFLDVISNAQGYVFSKRAEQKEREGFLEAAKTLYFRAFMGYQSALSSSPNEGGLLRSCATAMTKLYRLQNALRVENGASGGASVGSLTLSTHSRLGDSSKLDDPLLFGAQQYFKKAIQANRKHPESYSSYADFLADLGLDADAEAHYIEALLRDPFSVETLRSYARLLENMSQKEMANVFYERAESVSKERDRLMGLKHSNPLLLSSSSIEDSNKSSEKANKMNGLKGLPGIRNARDISL